MSTYNEEYIESNVAEKADDEINITLAAQGDSNRRRWQRRM